MLAVFTPEGAPSKIVRLPAIQASPHTLLAALRHVMQRLCTEVKPLVMPEKCVPSRLHVSRALFQMSYTTRREELKHIDLRQVPG